VADWCRGGEGLHKAGARLVHAGAASTDWCRTVVGLVQAGAGWCRLVQAG
jgi:hypothetical protein